MTSKLPTRREVASRLLPSLAVLGVCAQSGELFAQAGRLAGEVEDHGLLHNCECIHQEVVIKANRGRIYQALTDPQQFSKVTELSYHDAATDISQQVGGAFSIFGGLITG